MTLKEMIEKKKQDGTGGGKCYTKSPEENLKKFGTYKKYSAAAMNSLGKNMSNMTKEDWTKVGKGWDSKAEKEGK